MVPSWIADTIGIEARDGFKGKGGRGLDVNFARETDPVTEGAEMVGDTPGQRSARRMVPSTSVSKWELSREEFRATRLAHGLGEISSIKNETLTGESVDLGCLRVASSIHREIIVGAIISHDHQDVWEVGSLDLKDGSERNQDGGNEDGTRETIHGT